MARFQKTQLMFWAESEDVAKTRRNWGRTTTNIGKEGKMVG